MGIIGEPFALNDGEEWMGSALCAQIGGDLWHAERGEVQKVREAKQICGMCPVRAECADWGLRVDDRWAVLGGFSERERRRMKRGEAVEYVPPKQRKPKPQQYCLQCGVLVEAAHALQKYCDDQCRRQAMRERENETRRRARRSLSEDAA